jgi:hypothetical protein
MSKEKPAQEGDDMAAATAFPQPTRVDVRCRDRVRVPDGRAGEVVGFYRTRCEMALVRFEDGETRKFVLSELQLVAHN